MVKGTGRETEDLHLLPWKIPRVWTLVLDPKASGPPACEPAASRSWCSGKAQYLGKHGQWWTVDDVGRMLKTVVRRPAPKRGQFLCISHTKEGLGPWQQTTCLNMQRTPCSKLLHKVNSRNITSQTSWRCRRSRIPYTRVKRNPLVFTISNFFSVIQLRVFQAFPRSRCQRLRRKIQYYPKSFVIQIICILHTIFMQPLWFHTHELKYIIVPYHRNTCDYY